MAATAVRLQTSTYYSPTLCSNVLKVFPSSARQVSTSAVNYDTDSKGKFPSISSEPANLKRGTGGRSSFSGKVATVFGASGFLGRAVVNQLGKIGTQVIIPYRYDYDDVKHLKLCGDLGQILFQPFNLKDEGSLYKAMKYSNVVVNCIGRNFETKNFPFEEVNVKGARNIARIARESGVKTLIHVSALNVCEKPKPIVLRKGSQFLASKWRGEQAVREEFPDAIIFRPADIWGELDKFIVYYADHWRRSFTLVPLWKRGKGVIKQPVYFSNVAKGIAHAMMDPHVSGKIIQAVGPHRYELHELIAWFYRVMKRDYPIIDMRLDPLFWSKLIFSEIVFTRYRTISWNRVEWDNTTDVVDPDLLTLEDLGIQLTPLEERIFYELKIFRAHAYVDPMLTQFVRPVEPPPFAKD